MIREEKFRKLLLDAVNESIIQVLGETAAKVIYDFLEEKHLLRKEEIPEKLETFSSGLKEIVGSGTIVLEKIILRKLCTNLGLNYRYKEDHNFSDHIKEMKKQINQKRANI